MLSVVAENVCDEVLESALGFAGLDHVPDRGSGLLEFTHGPLFVVLNARVGQDLCREVMRELRPLIDRAAVAASSVAPPMLMDAMMRGISGKPPSVVSTPATRATKPTPKEADVIMTDDDDEMSVDDDWLSSLRPGKRVSRAATRSNPDVAPQQDTAANNAGGKEIKMAYTMPAPPDQRLLALSQAEDQRRKENWNLDDILSEMPLDAAREAESASGVYPLATQTLFLISTSEEVVAHTSKRFTGTAVTSVPLDLVELFDSVAQFEEAPFVIFHALHAPFQLESLVALSPEFPPGTFVLVWGGGPKMERIVRDAPRVTCSFAYLPDTISLDDVIEHCIDTVF